MVFRALQVVLTRGNTVGRLPKIASCAMRSVTTETINGCPVEVIFTAPHLNVKDLTAPQVSISCIRCVYKHPVNFDKA